MPIQSSDNLRGAALMVLAMAAFALEDLMIKWLAAGMPVGQILMLIGAAGAVVFAAIVAVRRERIDGRALLGRAVILRNLAEIAASAGFVSALALAPLSSVSAILLALPLVVTMGAALFLGEAVGWRRWTAILFGFAGVMLIVRPGTSDFDAAMLLAVASVGAMAVRDIATRAIAPGVSSMQLSVIGFAAMVPAGAVMLFFGTSPRLPHAADLWMLGCAVAAGVVGYAAMVLATRRGEMSVIAPFRYSRLIFAMALGWLAFDERPDRAMLAGAAMIVGSGLYSFARERRRALSSARDKG